MIQHNAFGILWLEVICRYSAASQYSTTVRKVITNVPNQKIAKGFLLSWDRQGLSSHELVCLYAIENLGLIAHLWSLFSFEVFPLDQDRACLSSRAFMSVCYWKHGFDCTLVEPFFIWTRAPQFCRWYVRDCTKAPWCNSWEPDHIRSKPACWSSTSCLALMSYPVSLPPLDFPHRRSEFGISDVWTLISCSQNSNL